MFQYFHIQVRGTMFGLMETVEIKLLLEWLALKELRDK